MKMVVFSAEDEELPFFEKYKGKYGIDLIITKKKPHPDNLSIAKGCDAINVLSDTCFTDSMWDELKEYGLKLAVTRTIGYEHMNKVYAEALGIKVMNISYSPYSVADYTVMMMLMILRNIKPIMLSNFSQDFTQGPFRGKELHNMTVGIIGAGAIGSRVIRNLQGFDCRVIYYSRRKKEELNDCAEYCDLEKVLQESDIISLHLCATEETRYFINRDKIAPMKKDAYLINTARGNLVDNEALIDALESNHLSGAALDVYDGDREVYYRDYRNKAINNREFAILSAMPNVLMLPHLAYFTDQAMEDMVRNSLMIATL